MDPFGRFVRRTLAMSWSVLAFTLSLAAAPPAPVLARDGARTAMEPLSANTNPSARRLHKGDGKGLVVAGITLLGISETWLASVEGIYAGMAGYALRYCWEGSPDYIPEECEEDDLVLIVLLPQRQAAMQMRWAGLSLLGAGLSLHGRRIRRVGPSPSPAQLRRMRVRRRVGLGLLGASAAFAIADALHVWGIWWWGWWGGPEIDMPAYYALHYTYFVTAKVMSAVGVALGPFADGYVREDALQRRIRLGPLGLAGGAGLVVAGRF
ncbi:MAG: hypothetical protein D6705_01850 [Deltaproteobacteria bacterium]|nr:MAG: hypothetical protein D6705_01850 [Deltaproteobacteria bacterium]